MSKHNCGARRLKLIYGLCIAMDSEDKHSAYGISLQMILHLAAILTTRCICDRTIPF